MRNPYTLTSVLFLIAVIAGSILLRWGPREYGFLLILYFVVVLGIRLDGISRQLAVTNELLRRVLKQREGGGAAAGRDPPRDRRSPFATIALVRAIGI